MISSSKLELIELCPGSMTLPWRDSPNDYSEAGNERHEADEDAINAGNVPDEYESRWPGLKWRAEVSYMYDVAANTGRFLGTGIKRAYGDQSVFDIPGTIDAEGRGDGILVVVDKKGYEAQAPAWRHRQVRFLALAAARAEPAARIVVAIRPEIGPMDIAEIDPLFDLDVIAHDVKKLMLDAGRARSDARAGKQVAFNIGRQCRWCPAFDDCPRQQELRALIVRNDERISSPSLLDDESAAQAYEFYKRVGILHKRLGELLYRHASSRPIQLGNGRVFGPVTKEGNEKLDGDIVHAVVSEMHDREVADRAVARIATKKRLSEALAGKRGAAVAVLKKVRERGGSDRKMSTSIEEHSLGPRLVSDEPANEEFEAAF